jgi:hypothetical protein
MLGRVDLIRSVLNCYKNPSYLEIGYGNGFCFNQMICKDKICVDPNPYVPEKFYNNQQCIKKTSDDFFASNTKMFDVIFIDGDHSYDAVKRDFYNSIKFLKENGKIILHDCNPQNKWMCRPSSEFFPEKGEPWNGDGGYKLLMELYQKEENFVWSTSNEDQGCCVVKRGSRVKIDIAEKDNDSYELFDKYRKEILNLKNIEEMIVNCCN